MRASRQHALIAGGGIGGLVAAHCLLEQDWTVEVFEKSPEPSGAGAGIQLSPNATTVLRRLGLLDELADKAFEPEALEMRTGRSGRRVFRLPLGVAASHRWGAPYLHLHRADLIEVLTARLEQRAPGALQTGQAVTTFEEQADTVRVHLSDGRAREGQLLVGADGIHSTIRRQLAGPEQARFTGNVAWRVVVPTAELGELLPPVTACIWTGPRRHAVTYRLRRGELANLVGVVERADWQQESWTEVGSRTEALADFSGFDPIVLRLIERAPAHYRWALFDREPQKTWFRGRVVLLGDAVHPMLPFLAQGAAQAIEDAWVLARSVATPDGLANSLLRYQTCRAPRTARVQAESLANMKRFHHSDLAYAPLRWLSRLATEQLTARQDWIYGYDVVNGFQ